MKSIFISIFLFIIVAISAPKAQEVTKNTIPKLPYDILTIGIGMGLDYGGIGGNLLYYPSANVGIFGGAGYAVAGLGYNFGAKIRFISKKQAGANFFVEGMYGYNAAIAISSASQYNKLFYGPSIGVGLDARYRPMSSGYLTVALLVPFRGSDVENYRLELMTKHGVNFNRGFMPFLISLGYRINIL